MKKNEVKYGIAALPKGAALCAIEKGGDKDNKATFRFSDTHKVLDKAQYLLVTNEIVMNDLYSDEWLYHKGYWIKADGKITWYASYKEASHAKASLTNRKSKIARIILVLMLVALIVYLTYKLIKSHKNTLNNEMD